MGNSKYSPDAVYKVEATWAVWFLDCPLCTEVLGLSKGQVEQTSVQKVENVNQAITIEVSLIPGCHSPVVQN